MDMLSNGYLSSVCEVKSITNDLYSTGYIAEISEDTIKINKKGDRMPLIRYNKPVKISIHNNKLGFIILVGTVFISTEFFMKISNVESLADYEKRNFFRISTKYDTYVNNEQDESFKVTVTNVSLSGLYFCCEENFQTDQVFNIGMDITGGDLFKAKIVRKEKLSERMFGYGCSLIEMTKQQQDLLCTYIFKIQREAIIKSKEKY